MIDLSKYQIYRKETSLDTKDDGTKIYMVESTRQAVNFDDVKDEYIKDLKINEVPKSNDAIIEDGKGGIIFIEFKNGYMDKAKQFAVRKKIYDSLLIFTDIVSAGIQEMRLYAEYILVYNEKVNAGNPDVIREQKRHVQPSVSFDYIAKEIGRYAKDEYVCFGINIFENYCFRKVHTYTEQEFEKYVQNL